MTSEFLSKDALLLKSVTVVICSYMRPWNLSETVDFLISAGLSALVLDGSLESNQQLADLESIQLRYIHAPRASYTERMAIASGLIGTPYVVTMCDDEYYVPSALAAAVSFLNANYDYSSCSGMAVGFTADKGSLKFQVEYPELRGFSLTDNDAVVRIRKHLSKYRVASYYGVVRTPVWSQAWLEISKESFSPFAIAELQFESATSFAGKLRVLDELLLFRNLYVAPVAVSGEQDRSNHISFSNWWTDKDFSGERREFLNRMSEILGAMPDTTIRISKAKLARAVGIAFGRYSSHWSRQAQILRNIFENLMSRLSFRRKIKKDSRIEPTIRSYLAQGAVVDEKWVTVISDRIRNFYGL